MKGVDQLIVTKPQTTSPLTKVSKQLSMVYIRSANPMPSSVGLSTIRTVLDWLHLPETNLEKLGISLDFSKDWVSEEKILGLPQTKLTRILKGYSRFSACFLWSTDPSARARHITNKPN